MGEDIKESERKLVNLGMAPMERLPAPPDRLGAEARSAGLDGRPKELRRWRGH